MADSFIVCCRSTGPDGYDFQTLDQILAADFAELNPRLLEPGVWLLRSSDSRWARHILQTLAMRMEEACAQAGCEVMVRSVGDPRDFAVFPHKSDEYDEFVVLESIVRKHHLHVD
ncbi:MAG TPA: hypothetical protein VMS56_07440 [Thermoanaerobaculia bacterium]|nr:hypothetical protein [Thermoanaerobaculia bacterium]